MEPIRFSVCIVTGEPKPTLCKSPHKFVYFQLSIVNGIRRMTLGFVPALAIDRVEIMKNNTMNDEMLAQRLSMMPVSYTIDKLRKRLAHFLFFLFTKGIYIGNMTFPTDCKCETGCDKCRVKLTLDYTNTSTEGDAVEVTDLDLVSKDPNVMMASKMYDNDDLG